MTTTVTRLPLVAFRAPVVKAGTVVLPALLANGVAVEISASLGLMRQIVDALFTGGALPPPPKAARPSFDGPARETLHAAWQRYIADPALTFGDVAAECGYSTPTIRAWFRRFAREPGGPVLKPNGKL